MVVLIDTNVIIDLCGFLQVVGINHDEVLMAIKKEKFKDFEDCLQDGCAKGVGAEYIITRNTEDFNESEVFFFSSFLPLWA